MFPPSHFCSPHTFTSQQFSQQYYRSITVHHYAHTQPSYRYNKSPIMASMHDTDLELSQHILHTLSNTTAQLLAQSEVTDAKIDALPARSEFDLLYSKSTRGKYIAKRDLWLFKDRTKRQLDEIRATIERGNSDLKATIEKASEDTRALIALLHNENQSKHDETQSALKTLQEARQVN
jgi:prephenate dehydrogenase